LRLAIVVASIQPQKIYCSVNMLSSQPQRQPAKTSQPALV